MNKTYFKYFLKIQLQIIAVVACFVIGFIFVFTFADTMRKIPESAPYPMLLCMYLSALRIPYTFCELFGYVYLIAATFSLWNLSQSHQITVLKSLGKSPKQILLPYFFLSFLMCIGFIFIFHPICNRAERLADYQHKIYLSQSNMYSDNVWMKDKDQVIYLGRFSKNNIENLLIKHQNGKSIYAESVAVTDNQWSLKNGYELKDDKCTYFDEKKITPVVVNEELELYSIPAHRCSIYSLIKCVFSQNSYATDIGKYVLNLNKIICNGLIFFLFSMIAAVVCLPLNRYKTKTFVSSTVIGFAVILRLINNICESMGTNGSLSPVLCVWIPMIIAFALSLSLLIWKEV